MAASSGPSTKISSKTLPSIISLTGKSLADYGDEIAVLGEGAFGRVYLADTGTKIYAVKMIKPRSHDGQTFHGILSEVAFPLHLEHPNIVSVTDVVFKNNVAYIVSPVADMDLSILIDIGYFKLGPEYIRQVAAQLVSGLAYLTAHDILHRDIKPHNVLCFAQPEGYQYKLADFGLARPSICHRINNDLGAFTRWYRSPEILQGQTPYTEKADVWALGCTLYELLGHGHAFYVPGNEDVQKRLLFMIRQTFGTQEPYRYLNWDGAEADFENFVRRMLVITPELRTDIFALQDHDYLRLGWAPYINTVSCQKRPSNDPLIFNFEQDLAAYEQSKLNTTLEWMTLAAFVISGLNSEVYNPDEACNQDASRVDWLARFLFLTYISKVETPTSRLQLVASASLYAAVNFFMPCGFTIDISDVYILIKDGYEIKQLEHQCRDLVLTCQFNLVGGTPFDLLGAQAQNLSLGASTYQLATLLLYLAGQNVQYATHPDLVHLCILEAQGRLKGTVHNNLRSKCMEIQERTEIALYPKHVWVTYAQRND